MSDIRVFWEIPLEAGLMRREKFKTCLKVA